MDDMYINSFTNVTVIINIVSLNHINSERFCKAFRLSNVLSNHEFHAQP